MLSSLSVNLWLCASIKIHQSQFYLFRKRCGQFLFKNEGHEFYFYSNNLHVSSPQCGLTGGCEMDCEAHEVRPHPLFFSHDYSSESFTDKLPFKIWDRIYIISFWTERICTIYYIIRSYSHLSLTLAPPVQDLLCYLIDDGGFLIMSNQIQDWNKVRRKLFHTHACIKHTFRDF